MKRGREIEVCVSLALVFFLLLVLAPALVSAACDPAQDLTLDKSQTYFGSQVGYRFSHDFNLTGGSEDGVQYTYAFLGGYISGFHLSSDGVMEFIPENEDVGTATLALVAVRGECADTAVLTFSITSGPVITGYTPPAASVSMNLTQNMTFSVTAHTNEQNKTLTYKWLLDGEQYAEGAPSFTLVTGTTLYGEYDLTARVIDSKGVFSDHTWKLSIAKVNLPPMLYREIPGVSVYKNTLMGAYNLRDYFYDPERGPLIFGVKKVVPNYGNLTYADVTAQIDEVGYVTYYPATDTVGYAYFVFNATDREGLSKESNIVRIDVLKDYLIYDINSTQIDYFCGDYSCNAEENCTNCPFDCGLCDQGDLQGCLPQWNCTDWTPCSPEGRQYRNCSDISNCGDDRSMPDVTKTCNYIGNCSDGLQTGTEEGVDCGGPCAPCPSCADGIQNQGEEGVDCGGPCAPCLRCSNGVKDGNETDVDCGGGTCLPCDGEKSCLKTKDCLSLNCSYLVCGFATCFDNIRNQDETGVDCGGLCGKKCSNCSDGEMNGNEKGVDCGGPCKPCPACDDKEKNGDEWLVDCGGACRSCTLKDFLSEFFIAFLSVSFLVAALLVSLVGYFFYLLSKPEEAERLYDNNTFFILLTELHHFCRICRRLIGGKGFISTEMYKTYKDQIENATGKENFTNKELFALIERVFGSVFSLPEGFDSDVFYRRIRTIRLSPFIKVLVVGFHKRAEILQRDVFIPTEEQQDFVAELKFLLLELSRA